MSRTKHFVPILVFSLLAAFGVRSPAEDPTEPTLQQLLKAIPVLFKGNAELTSFRCTLETSVLTETPLVQRIAFRAPNEFLVVGSVGDDPTPFELLVDGKAMIFDAAARKLLLVDGVLPGCNLSANKDRINFKWLISAADEAEFSLNLPKLLNRPEELGKIEQDESGQWRLTTPSASGNSRTIATFEAASERPLLRAIEVRSVEDDTLLIAVRDIAINQEGNTLWPQFPSSEQLPSGVDIFAYGPEHGPKSDAKLDAMKTFLCATFAQVALRNERWRQEKIFDGVDWELAVKLNRDVAPKLTEICRFPGEIAAKESPETKIRR